MVTMADLPPPFFNLVSLTFHLTHAHSSLLLRIPQVRGGHFTLPPTCPDQAHHDQGQRRQPPPRAPCQDRLPPRHRLGRHDQGAHARVRLRRRRFRRVGEGRGLDD